MSKNKRALVVGAGTEGNIGYAIASLLESSGWEVFAADKKFDHQKFNQFFFDVTSEPQVYTVVKSCGRHLDLLVNSAGVNILGTLDGYTLADFNKTIAVNLTSNYLLLQAYQKAYGEVPGAKRFIAITSDTAEIPKSSSFAYGASKAGANQFLRSAARELNKYSGAEWLVTGLALGRVRTPMDTITVQDVAEQRGISEEESEAMLNANIPLGRGMEPDEVAQWVQFLAEHGGFATGNILRIDAGQLQG